MYAWAFVKYSAFFFNSPRNKYLQNYFKHNASIAKFPVFQVESSAMASIV